MYDILSFETFVYPTIGAEEDASVGVLATSRKVTQNILMI